MKGEITLKGKVKVKKNGKIVNETNMILDVGLERMTRLLLYHTDGNESAGGESDFEDGDIIPMSHVTIGDGNDETQEYMEDIQGNVLEEEEISVELSEVLTPDMPGVDQYITRFVAEFEECDPNTHYEAVLADDEHGLDRTCLARVVLGDGIEVQDGEDITYIWEIFVQRGV